MFHGWAFSFLRVQQNRHPYTKGGIMPLQTIKRFATVPAGLQLALKSPGDYIELINKVNPAWGMKLKSNALVGSLAWCALWAGAVTVANACRISETLRVCVGHVLPNGMAWATGSKGSNARMLYLGLSPEQVIRLKELSPTLNVFPDDYLKVYRATIQAGFALKLPNHKHLAVTHAGRYELVKQVSRETSAEVAGELLGHRNRASVEFYANPQNIKPKVRKK